MAGRRNLDKPLEIGQAMADATIRRRRAATRSDPARFRSSDGQVCRFAVRVPL
jgi:hypothetical protein